MSIYLKVVNADRKRIFRDPFLLLMVVMPIFFALALRYFLPVLRNRFIASVDLANYYPLIIGLFVVTPALYIAAVVSLQIIEEQEERITTAVAATPFSLRSYYRTTVGRSRTAVAVLLAVTLSLQVPVIALLISTYASNQVEGMVALKSSSLLVLPALAIFFVKDPWHLLAGVLPAYWPVMALFSAFRAGVPPYFFGFAILVGTIYQLVLAKWLFARFDRKTKSAF